jgi:NAD dependent epimerase/dehydratase
MNLRGRSVLVTGADGFIGSHLVERLLVEGCRVRAFVLYNSFSSWGWLEALPRDVLRSVEVFAGDVRDPHGVRKALEGIDVVFPLASLIGIPFSYHSPDSYVDTNVKGTLNVLQAARDRGGIRVLVTSTSEVYGTARYVPIDEVHPLQGQSPYSATKIAADKLAEAFHLSFDLPVTTVRPFNTYGPRQSSRAIIPTIITQILSGATGVKLGSLAPTRDLNYVLDTVEGFVQIALSDATVGETINIASGREISVGDLAREIAATMGTAIRILGDEERMRPSRSEVGRLLGANAKLQRLTAWQPRYTLERGLEETIAWFREPQNLGRYKPDVYSV